jgi:4-hydroxyphenylpyruvate dioxygenase
MSADSDSDVCVKDESKRPIGRFFSFHHCEFFVGNALQAASFYVTRFGFKRVAYKGLETGSKEDVVHVLQQGGITFSFRSQLNPGETEISKTLEKSGDGVHDVAFHVDDARALYEKAVSRGATSVSEPEEITDDDGTVVLASVRTYGDTVHTFVEKRDYKGVFLPGYAAVTDDDPLHSVTPSPGLEFIDHIVGNQPDLEMEPTAHWYEKMLDFHRYWSVDETIVHFEFSGLRSVVMADFDEKVKMPINEPADGKKKSQIQEYVEYYGGPGVQHIALNTPDIINAITQLRARGVQFLDVPAAYYEDLREKLKKSPVQVKEDIDVLQKLGVLIDYDDKGYLLQLFTKPVEDRPTLFIEIIQRNNHDGFGVGNFRALFQCIYLEQERRGNVDF